MADGGASLAIDEHRSVDEMVAFSEGWNALVAATTPPLPNSAFAWVAAYYERSLGANQSVRVLSAWRDGRLVGVLPLVDDTASTLGVRRVVAAAPYAPHTLAVDVIVAPGEGAGTIAALLDAAAGGGRSSVRLHRVPEGSPTLAAARERFGRRSLTECQAFGAYIPIHGAPEEYFRGLSRNFRNNLNKARNKLNRLTDVRTVVLQGAEASPALLPRFADVEASGWKGRQGSAIASSPRRTAFYQTLTNRLADAGWLEWHFLEGDGQTLAANLALRIGRSVFLWKLAYAEPYAKFSPGNLLIERVVQDAFASGDVDEINLLTDHKWYDNWKMVRRPYHSLTVFAPGAIPLLMDYAPSAMKHAGRRFSQFGLVRRLRGN